MKPASELRPPQSICMMSGMAPMHSIPPDATFLTFASRPVTPGVVTPPSEGPTMMTLALMTIPLGPLSASAHISVAAPTTLTPTWAPPVVAASTATTPVLEAAGPISEASGGPAPHSPEHLRLTAGSDNLAVERSEHEGEDTHVLLPGVLWSEADWVCPNSFNYSTLENKDSPRLSIPPLPSGTSLVSSAPPSLCPLSPAASSVVPTSAAPSPTH